MFKCQSCSQFSKPKENMNKVVVSNRQVEYNNTIDEKIKTTYGWEIEKEIAVCKQCKGKYDSSSTT